MTTKYRSRSISSMRLSRPHWSDMMSVLPMIFNFSSGLATVVPCSTEFSGSLQATLRMTEPNKPLSISGMKTFVKLWNFFIQLDGARVIAASTRPRWAVVQIMLSSSTNFAYSEEKRGLLRVPTIQSKSSQINLHGPMIPHLMFSVRW